MLKKLYKLGVALYHYFTLLSKVNPLPVTFFQNTLFMSYFELKNIINLNKKIEFEKNKAVKGFQSKVK